MILAADLHPDTTYWRTIDYHVEAWQYVGTIVAGTAKEPTIYVFADEERHLKRLYLFELSTLHVTEAEARPALMDNLRQRIDTLQATYDQLKPATP